MSRSLCSRRWPRRHPACFSTAAPAERAISWTRNQLDAEAESPQVRERRWEFLAERPRTHHDDDVTLAVKIDVSGIEATNGFGGLPEFSSRQINTVISLKDGETGLLAGLIRDDETTLFEGIPGLSDLPGIGRLFSHTLTQADRTDVIVTLTPHIVRLLDLTESDLQPLVVGRESVSPIVGLSVPGPSRAGRRERKLVREWQRQRSSSQVEIPWIQGRCRQ